MVFCRYRAHFDQNGEFAQLVQQKLVAYKADDPSMGDVSYNFTILRLEQLRLIYTLMKSVCSALPRVLTKKGPS